MKKVNISEVREDPWQSPKGKYAISFRGISEALGREPQSLDLSKRWPFDLEWNRLPPGKRNYPCGGHTAQWEMYLIVSGNGSVRDKDGTISTVVAGDAFIFGPDEPHQIINTGDVDLVYYVIADNPIGESNYYPDSKKWMVNKTSAKDRVFIKGVETDYLDGEE
ncbi:MAG TPA: cupin domain-containing protein [Chthoniobacterales bacterium]